MSAKILKFEKQSKPKDKVNIYDGLDVKMSDAVLQFKIALENAFPLNKKGA